MAAVGSVIPSNVSEQPESNPVIGLTALLASTRALELEDAAGYLQSAEQAAAIAGDPDIPAVWRIRARNELGNAWRINGNFRNANDVLDEVIADARELPTGEERDSVLALAHLRKAIVSDLTGAIVEGVSHLDQASTHFDALQDEDGLARCDMVRAALYMRIDEFEVSEQSYQRALAFYRRTEQSERIGMVMANLSALYRYMNRLEEAVVAGREALSLARGKLLRVTATGNLAFALAEAGQLEEALAMAHETEDTITELGDPNYTITYRRAVATILLNKDEPQAALEMLTTALSEAEEKGYTRDITDVHGLLANVYSALGDYRNAFEFQKKYFETVLSQSGKKAASQLEVHKWRLELENSRLQAEQEKDSRRRLAESLIEMSRVNKQLSARAVELEWSSYRDSLTGLANRRYFDERLGDFTARALETGNDLAIMVLDLDSFKGINDRFGHLTGDDVLRETARIMESGTRRSDLAARLGGEEFAVLLDATVHPRDLYSMAEKLRRAFESNDWETVAPGLKATVSIGTARLSEVGGNPLNLLELADQRLYAAKRSGRNRVVSQQESAAVPAHKDEST